MSKPIFIVRLPNVFTEEHCDNYSKLFKDKFSDYHVLVCALEKDDISFECFNTTDLDTKSFEELKELVKTYKSE